MRLLERVILKCEGSVVLKAIESTECVGDSEKARLGNTTFPELTFPNSGCRGAATLWLFQSETRVNFAFWLLRKNRHHAKPCRWCRRLDGGLRGLYFPSLYMAKLIYVSSVFKPLDFLRFE